MFRYPHATFVHLVALRTSYLVLAGYSTVHSILPYPGADAGQ